MTIENGDQSQNGFPDQGDQFASIFVRQLRVRNFRGLEDCEIEFEPDLTLLVGRNNVGKSRVLRALAIALGAVAADRDDLTVSGSDTADIDIVLAPSSTADEEDVFDDRVAQRLGAMVQPLSDEPPRERFAWRTTIRLAQEGLGVRTDQALLTYDQTVQEWQLGENATSLATHQRSIVAADLVDTRRDLVDELTRRGSPIRRILNDLEIPSDRRAALEEGLKALGGDIVTSSESLTAVRTALETLSQSVDAMGAPSLEPLPVRLEELGRSVSINLDTGAGGLPMRFHGAGARSLSSLQVQGVLYDRRLGRDGPALRPHPVSLIEEPEAHLHPQAQFELPHLLHRIQGQVVVSTHSTHLVSVVEFRSIRILRDVDAGVAAIDLRPAHDDEPEVDRARRPHLYREEMEKVRRMVERPFGELLFAAAVVIGDGATERALLPRLARHVLGDRAHGLCVVDPGSMASDYAGAIVKFANLVDLPWLLFSDSDAQGQQAARRLDQTYADGNEDHIVWVPEAPTEGGKDGATERMFIDFDLDLCVAASEQIGFAGSREDLLSFMTKHKGIIGRLLAEELISRHPWREPQKGHQELWPSALCDLIDKLERLLPHRKISYDSN